MLVTIILITLASWYVLVKKMMGLNQKIQNLEKSIVETRNEMSERDRLANRRIDGEIDRINHFTDKFTAAVYELRDKVKKQENICNDIEVLESEVDKLSHNLYQIEVSLQNEINKLK